MLSLIQKPEDLVDFVLFILNIWEMQKMQKNPVLEWKLIIVGFGLIIR